MSNYNKIELLQKGTDATYRECREALEATNYSLENAKKLLQNNKNQDSNLGAIALGNIQQAQVNASLDVFNTPQGHGYAAEQINHTQDVLLGRKPEMVGTNNAKNGPDRFVNNQYLQTKYCRAAKYSIDACFENNQYKYIMDGTPMAVEVPADQYDQAVEYMRKKIQSGEVPGVMNSDEASKLVKKGYFTYDQARNVAKFGTVESLTFDAVNGVITSVIPFGISTIMTFALEIWNGTPTSIALENALRVGVKVGVVVMTTSIVSAQLSRTGVNQAVRGVSDKIIGTIGPQNAAKIANSLRGYNAPNIYGAAATKNASKTLGNNMIAGIASIAIMTTFDAKKLFSREMSPEQFFKNTAVNSVGVAGGTAGAILGTIIFPGAGTAVGTLIGVASGMLGGTMSSLVAKKGLDYVWEDDTQKMIKVIEQTYEKIAQDYVMTEREVKFFIEEIQKKITPKYLLSIYKMSNREVSLYAELEQLALMRLRFTRIMRVNFSG